MKKIFTLLAYLTLLFLQVEQGHAESFSIDEIDGNTYVQRYNSLPTLEDADRILRSSPNFHKCLQDAKEIVLDYGLEKYVGLRLIHQHFPLKDQEIVTETCERIGGELSLVSSVLTYEGAKHKGALPSSWILSEEGQVYVFETSVDPAVARNIQLIEQHPDFFKRMATALKNYKLSNSLALAVLQRDYLEEPTEDNLFLEAQHLNGKNVVQLKNRNDFEADKIINSAWSFTGSNEENGIRVQAGCCKTK